MKKNIISFILAISVICTAGNINNNYHTGSLAGDNTIVSAAAFVPRLSAPDKSDGRYYSNNVFYQNGYGMPNCTCYAFGRAWEILGSEPKLSHGNGNTFYTYNKSNNVYPYGSEPKLGAIACWNGKSGSVGHVAVVEKIEGDNITISESHYTRDTSMYSVKNWDLKTINKYQMSSYISSFQGYIYLGDYDPVPPILPGEVDRRYATPVSGIEPKATSGLITVYDQYGNAYASNVRNIAYNDKCTVHEVYTNGFCKVTYPTSKGDHTEYAKASDFDIPLVSIIETFFDFWGVEEGITVNGQYKLWFKQTGHGSGKECDVNVYVDGKEGANAIGTIYQDDAGLFSYNLNTTKYSNGKHTVYAVLRDTKGAEVWKSRTININNQFVNLGNDFVASISMKSANDKYVSLSPDNRSNVVLYGYKDKNFSGTLYWRFQLKSNGYYRISSLYKNLSLDVANEKNTPGTNIGVAASNDSAAQEWQIINYNGGYALIPRETLI